MSQEGSLDFRLVKRICQLQEALDQALDSLDELKLRVQDQHLLESQLAKTEKFSNVQQQLINHFKQQLAQKNHWQHQVLQELMAHLTDLIERQQIELERLHVRIQQGQTEIQNYLVRLKNHCQGSQTTPYSPQQERMELESEVMVARALTVSLGAQLKTAQQHIQALDIVLNQHQISLAKLEASVEQLEPLSDEFQIISQPNLIPAIDTDQNSIPFELRHELKAKQLIVDELETELDKQFKQQTQLRHHCQELAAQRDHYKRQTDDLERHNTELQEQILKQASQASEYEATIQYWKEQYLACRDQLAGLGDN